MNRMQLERIYQANGLNDYKLQNLGDLLKVHGVDYKAVKGYQTLTEENRALYEKFMVNYFNAYGLDLRMTIEPNGIYFVEDIEYMIYNEFDDTYTIVGEEINIIENTGEKVNLRNRIFEDKEEGKPIIKDEPKYYLRIEYLIDGRAEWLHIINEKEWY